jgi:hypothetical protein
MEALLQHTHTHQCATEQGSKARNALTSRSVQFLAHSHPLIDPYEMAWNKAYHFTTLKCQLHTKVKMVTQLKEKLVVGVTGSYVFNSASLVLTQK